MNTHDTPTSPLPSDLTETSSPESGTSASGRSRFDDGAYLRAALTRLHDLGADAWRTDPQANELMQYAIDRFAKLAVKHGLDPADGGPAAWEAMRDANIVTAKDPWGYIVRAVTTTLAAAQFADEALCSVETARGADLSGCRAERFSERDNEIWEYHPAFSYTDSHDAERTTRVDEQADALGVLFTTCGWPPLTGRAIAAVLNRLADAGSRPAAYERLRRNRKIATLAGLPSSSWRVLLRVLLGDPTDPEGLTPKGQGVLLRLATGEELVDLARDRELFTTLRNGAPPWRRFIAPTLTDDDPLLSTNRYTDGHLGRCTPVVHDLDCVEVAA